MKKRVPAPANRMNDWFYYDNNNGLSIFFSLRLFSFILKHPYHLALAQPLGQPIINAHAFLSFQFGFVRIDFAIALKSARILCGIKIILMTFWVVKIILKLKIVVVNAYVSNRGKGEERLCTCQILFYILFSAQSILVAWHIWYDTYTPTYYKYIKKNSYGRPWHQKIYNRHYFGQEHYYYSMIICRLYTAHMDIITIIDIFREINIDMDLLYIIYYIYMG